MKAPGVTTCMRRATSTKRDTILLEGSGLLGTAVVADIGCTLDGRWELGGRVARK